MRVAALALLGVLSLVGCSCDGDEETVEALAPVTGPWLGQQPPGTEPINDEHKEFYPSLTTSGDLYFTSDRPGGLGGEDIWCVDVALIEGLRP